MPVKVINDPEEWEKLTGSRGSVYIHFGTAPAKRPEPTKKSQEMFLCPHCYETLTSPRSSVLECTQCKKTWG